MKICIISDTHGKDSWLDLPKCDILIHCGDFYITSLAELEYANRWFGRQKANYKILVAGNHDTYLEHIGKDVAKSLFTNVIYLENELVEIEGLRIYGSPYSPEFNNWSFMYQRCSLEAKNIWQQIPENLDILVTHAPPYGILDRNLSDIRCGCEVLQREILKKKPKLSCFGHIHRYGGQSTTQENIDFYNCSVLDEEYKLKNKPTIIEI